MTSSPVIPRADAAKLAFIQHLNATLPSYAATLDFSGDDLAELDRATAWYKFSVDLQTAGKAFGEATVAFRNAVKNGSENGTLTVFLGCNAKQFHLMTLFEICHNTLWCALASYLLINF